MKTLQQLERIRQLTTIAAAALLLTLPMSVRANTRIPLFELSLTEAESRALSSSNQLKATVADFESAGEQADAEFALLLPRLTFDASYRYVTNVPNIPISFPGLPPLPFGAHSNYSVGPTLSYTLWDTGLARNAYHGLSKLAESRLEDSKNAKLQLLLTLRAAYVRVQLALEEMRLTNDSLKLSRSQNRDITANYHAGAASRLDLVDSQREVISYELQFRQKQADLSSALKDLLALLNQKTTDLTRPGPPGVETVTLEVKLDPLEESLRSADRWAITPPTNSQPSLKSQGLLAESSELSAASLKSSLYPTVQVSARASYDYPNGITLTTAQQNTFTVGLSMPLFEMDRTRHLAGQQLKAAQAARLREEQLKINLDRDYAKGNELLTSLREQQRLSADDVGHSEEAARLYYSSYRAGKTNLIDVQSANNRALQAKVGSARITAQILDQLISLKAISGEETSHDQ